jgi:hypothetical protein
VQTWGRRIKNWNYPVYYVGKKVLLVGLLGLIFYWAL